MQRIIVISGPTASGKSDLAIELAERMNGEIISADSVAIYEGFDVGSAKPSSEEVKRVPHHLISTLKASEDFNAGKFSTEARRLISEILARRKVPIICGGTGLYIRSLINGLISDDEDRVEIDDEEQSVKYERLKHLDPASAAQIHPNDEARTRRALEYILRTGRSISEMRAEHRHTALELSALIFVIEPKREELYPRIDARVMRMLNGGLIEETKELLKTNPRSAKPFSAIGYRHVLQYLDDRDPERLRHEMSRDTRRFAKRQYTWWRHQPKLLGWREIEPTGQPFESARCFLECEGDFREDAVFVARLASA